MDPPEHGLVAKRAQGATDHRPWGRAWREWEGIMFVFDGSAKEMLFHDITQRDKCQEK